MIRDSSGHLTGFSPDSIIGSAFADAINGLLVDSSNHEQGSALKQDTNSQPTATSATTLRAIPTQFRGEWNDDASACGTGLSDSRLVITSGNLAFYESNGEVRRVAVHNARAITVAASFAGEGQVWDRTQQLVLSGSGLDLTINSEGTSSTLHRCPRVTK